MRLGYVTNGFAHHNLEDTFSVLAEIGYECVAVTLDRHVMDPPTREGVSAAARRITRLMASTGLGVTLETGARFVLDPQSKHQPTLISATAEGRARRVEYINAAVELAANVRAESVSLWSGAAEDEASDHTCLERLSTSLRQVLDTASKHGVKLAFEPEPGMFIDTMVRFERLYAMMNHALLGLTLDVGHVHCLADGNLGDHLRRWRQVLWNVHIEDMRRGVHQHLMFGDGDMDVGAALSALAEIEYAGPVHVELSRHSHDAVETARRAYAFVHGVTGSDG